MGLGDERGNIGQPYVEAAAFMANELYPDLETIPGGERAREQREANKQAFQQQGALVLRHLDQNDLIDIDVLVEILARKS